MSWLMNLYPRFHYSLLKKVQIAGENHTKTVYTLKVLVAILASPKHRAFTRSYRSNVESKSSLTVIEQGTLRSSCTNPVAGFQSPGGGGTGEIYVPVDKVPANFSLINLIIKKHFKILLL